MLHMCNIIKLCDNNVAYTGHLLWINACFWKQVGSVQYTSTVKYTVVILSCDQLSFSSFSLSSFCSEPVCIFVFFLQTW